MRRGRFRREKQIEVKVNDRAIEELQVPNIALKLLLGVATGWPDRIYLLGFGRVLFIEFKDPDDGELSAKQRLMHKLLRSMGYGVQVHDNEDEAVQAIGAAKMEASRLSEKGRKVSRRPRRCDGAP